MTVEFPTRRVGEVRAAWRGLDVLLTLSTAVVVVGVAGSAGSPTFSRDTTQALIYVVATVGFFTFVGNSGIFAFGHVAFMAIGAYATSLLVLSRDGKAISLPDLPASLQDLHAPPLAASVAGALVASVVALFLAIPLMRISGIAAALTSFAFLQIVVSVAGNWPMFTNGEAGLQGIPITMTPLRACACAIGVIIIAYVFQESRGGMRLRAAREDEIAALSLKVDVRRERRVAFVLSAGIMGFAGGLYGMFLGTLTPQTLYLGVTVQVLVMLIVGGMTSLSGAVLGSLFVSALSMILRAVEKGTTVGPVDVHGPLGIQAVGFAVVLLLTLLLRPRGLVGGREVRAIATCVRLARRIRLGRSAEAARPRSVSARGGEAEVGIEPTGHTQTAVHGQSQVEKP